MKTTGNSFISVDATSTGGDSIATSKTNDDKSASPVRPAGDVGRFSASHASPRAAPASKLSKPTLGKPARGKIKSIVKKIRICVGLFTAFAVGFATGCSWEDPSRPAKSMDLPPGVLDSPVEVKDGKFGTVKVTAADPVRHIDDLDKSQLQLVYDWADPLKDGPLSFYVPTEAKETWRTMSRRFCCMHKGSTLEALRIAAIVFICPVTDCLWPLSLGSGKIWHLDTSQKIKALPGVADFKKAYDHYKEDPEMLTRFVVYLMSGKKTSLAEAHKAREFKEFYDYMDKNMKQLEKVLPKLPGPEEEYNALVLDRRNNHTPPLSYTIIK
eukprot:GHVT01060300.1.p1 GENE.GHVT01060300.1~~GHVT01060300.1.p1  ORF type:complete len:326 (+),score=37.19 GHVT01060300.1:160-1137(+)